MVQYIKQGDIFGRIGSGIGKGLAEQLPEEITRGRLSQGLQNLGNKQGLSPFQAFTGLASLPGVTPQMIESGSQLLRQQGMLQGARNFPNQSTQNQPSTNQFDVIRNQVKPNITQQEIGLVEPETTQATLHPYIPKDLNQLNTRAVELYDQSPGLYPDFPSAFNAAVLEDQKKQEINAAQQTARNLQQNVQNTLRDSLRSLQSAANAKVPDNVYQKVENKALDDIRKGKDELTAAKDARDELDKISRDYSSIDAFGNMTLLASKPKEVRSSINSLRQKFEENNDLENFADALIGRNGLSNEYAYYLALPPPPKISSVLNSLPELRGGQKPIPGAPGFMQSQGIKKSDIAEKSLKASEKLAKMLDKNDSILAISHALSEKGYDPLIWRKYLNDHRRELNLSDRQGRELDKTDKMGQGFLNDWWLKIMGEM